MAQLSRHAEAEVAPVGAAGERAVALELPAHIRASGKSRLHHMATARLEAWWAATPCLGSRLWRCLAVPLRCHARMNAAPYAHLELLHHATTAAGTALLVAVPL